MPDSFDFPPAEPLTDEDRDFTASVGTHLMGLKLSGVEDAAEWIRHMVKMARAYGRIEGVRMSGIEGFGDDEIEAGPPLPPPFESDSVKFLQSDPIFSNVPTKWKGTDPSYEWIKEEHTPLNSAGMKKYFDAYTEKIVAVQKLAMTEMMAAKSAALLGHLQANVIGQLLNFIANNAGQFIDVKFEQDHAQDCVTCTASVRVVKKG